MELRQHRVASWMVSPLEIQVQLTHCNKGIKKGPDKEYTKVEIKWPACKLVLNLDGLKSKHEIDCAVNTLIKKNLFSKANILLLKKLCNNIEEGISYFEYNEEGGQPN